MRIRHDLTFISSVLFTIALLWLVPHNLRYASTWRNQFLTAGRVELQNYLMPIGFSSLTLVVIGLIVIWTEYHRSVRWTWFVMLVIVWGFAFPVYVLPELLNIATRRGAIDWSAWIGNAVREPGIDRAVLKIFSDFVMMLVALILPVRSFFSRSPS